MNLYTASATAIAISALAVAMYKYIVKLGREMENDWEFKKRIEEMRRKGLL